MDEIAVIKTDKFKNNAIDVIIPLELNEYVTDYNLMGALLKRGSKKYPSTMEIWKHLQDMYGAVFDVVVNKKGERLFLNFYIQFIDERFAINNESIMDQALDFLQEIINEPLIDENGFNSSYFDTEVLNLKSLINSRIDNKDTYAVERLEELLTEGEPYSIYKYGNVERLDKINNKELAALWMDICKNKERIIFACGNIDEKSFKEKAEKLTTKEIKYVPSSNKARRDEKFNEVKETMDINQGKLCLGFRSNISIFDGDYFGLSVMNSILGGGTHSKLFNEVREKNSLAYYTYSFVEKFIGILVIASGIDSKNYEKARDICIEQLEKIRNGEVSEHELLSAKKKMISDLRALTDSIYSIIDYISTLRAYGIQYGIEDVIKGIEEVNIERVINCSKEIYLNKVYFLSK